MTTAAIRLDGVDMRFGSTRALKSIDLQLDRVLAVDNHGHHA